MRHYIFISLFLFTSSLLVAETATSGKIFGSRTGLVDKSMNPAISINGLFLGSYGTAQEKTGLRLQEVEAAFSAAVDPYFFANIILTSEGGEAVTPEEAYVITLSIPMVTIKAGKFLANFGKNNLIHTHAQPLIDRPIVNKSLLGDEGLNSVGVQAALLVPVSWYMEFTLAGMSGSQTSLFANTSDESLFGVARLENLFDLNDETTLSLGVSYSMGDNQFHNVSHFGGADTTLKYVSGKGKGEFAIAWTNEYIRSKRTSYSVLSEWEDAWGLSSTVLVRLSPRFWTGGRFDYTNITLDGSQKTKGENLVFAFVPSEFSAIRLQTGLIQPSTGGKSQWQALVQYNMTIGSHPAHAY